MDEVNTHAISTLREIFAVSSAREIASTMRHLTSSPNEEVDPKNTIKMMEYGIAKIKIGNDEYLVMDEAAIKPSNQIYYDQRVAAKIKADSTSILHDDIEVKSAFSETHGNRFRIILEACKIYFSENGILCNIP